MTLSYVSGNIFDSSAQVLTNPVNCVGVMGAGLALHFKDQYPEMFSDYRQKCLNKQVLPGVPYLWENRILNFPTKRHWRAYSRLDDIDSGLKYLSENYYLMGIKSVAIPSLGCGHGGLKWEVVKPLIEHHIAGLPYLTVYIYI